MSEAITGLLSALVGGIIGSYLSWILANRSAREHARTEILIRTYQHVEALRTSYSTWYSQFAIIRLRFVRPIHEGPDPVLHAIRESLERAKSMIHSDRVTIAAHLPRKVSSNIVPLLDEIIRVLADSENAPAIEVITELVQKTEDTIVVNLPKYAK